MIHTKDMAFRFTQEGNLAVQSAHFLLAGNFCKARMISSGVSIALAVVRRGPALRPLAEPGGPIMRMVVVRGSVVSNNNGTMVNGVWSDSPVWNIHSVVLLGKDR